MDLSRLFFLSRYYIANAVRSKIAGEFAKQVVVAQKARWKSLRIRNSHHTWLIVGNGPSLNVEDLETLAHLPSVASNKITLAYNSTNWRPTFYTIGDPVLLFKLPRSHYNAIPLVLVPHFSYYLVRTKKKIPWLSTSLADGVKWFERNKGMPDPVKNGFIRTFSVTTYNIQIAMWCGAKTIFLIGCDHNYCEKEKTGVAKVTHEGVCNHFHQDYRKPGEIVNNAPIAQMERGYEFIQKIAIYHKVEIINISRRTALQVFDRGTVEQAAKTCYRSSHMN